MKFAATPWSLFIKAFVKTFSILKSFPLDYSILVDNPGVFLVVPFLRIGLSASASIIPAGVSSLSLSVENICSP